MEDGKIINWKQFKFLKQEYKADSPLDSHDLLALYEFFADRYRRDELNSSQENYSYIICANNDCDDINELNEPISLIEIDNVLKSLNTGKSVAEDLISNEMLKSLDTLGIQALNCTFNHCLSKGIYPWNTSVITPIHKSGDINNPDNYRAIAVSSCLGKTFSSILLNRLTNFRNNHCSDPPNQLGFCKGAQTNDHVLTLKTIIDKYRQPGKANLFACFVDFKKAFDSIRRDLLLSKIANLGINGAFFLVIKTMYEKSTAKIKINNLLSDSFNIDKGTEQGHPMSPELFKMFIRDLSSALTCTGKYPFLFDAIINHLLWADDLIPLAIDEVSL